MTVSVAMCTYNGEKYVEAQLRSILSQTRKPDEIVICDDCSSDSTIEIITGILLSQDIPYRIEVNEKNIGFVKNFEKATRLCSCDIVFWADQDDIWFPEKIVKMILPFIENTQCVYCFCDAIVVDSELNCLFDSLNNKWGISLTSIGSEIKKFHHPYGCTLALRRTEVLKWMPFVDSHDSTVARCARATGGITEIKEKLMYYRRHDKAVTFVLNNNLKKKNILARGAAFYKSIKCVSKGAWFDYPEWQKSKLSCISEDDIKDELALLNYKKHARFYNLLGEIVKANKLKSIFILHNMYVNGFFSLRGDIKTLLYDVIYILLHNE